MLIEATCPRCKATLSIDSTFVGSKRTCTACQGTFVLERPSAAKRPPAPPKQAATRLLAVELTCESCQHPIRVDASFAGAKRTCPNCGHLFTVTLPSEVKARVEARRDEYLSRRVLERTACPKCHRFGSAAPDVPSARCVYCGAATALDKAVALAVRLDAVEDGVTVALLVGRSDAEISARYAAEGLQLVGAVIARKRSELPLIRKRALAAKNQGASIVLGPPPRCERCHQSRDIAPYSLRWSLVDEERRELHGVTALTIFAGVVVTEKKQTVRFIEEVVYVCDGCHRSRVPPAPGFSRESSFALPPL